MSPKPPRKPPRDPLPADADVPVTLDDAIDRAGETLDGMTTPTMDADDLDPAKALVAARQADEILVLPEGYIEPWTRRPDENDHAWEMFRWYRDQGPGRRIPEVARHFKTGLANLHQHYTAKHEWQSRALAWDQHMDRLYRINLQEQVKEMSARHADQIVSTLEVLALPFNEVRRRVAAAGPKGVLKDLGNLDVRRLFDMALKASRVMAPLMSAERLARGMPTEIIQTEGEVRVVHDLGTDQIAQVLEVLDRAGAFAGRERPLGAGEVIDAESFEVDDDHPDGAPVQPEAARPAADE
jgi:hypothetical protein